MTFILKSIFPEFICLVQRSYEYIDFSRCKFCLNIEGVLFLIKDVLNSETRIYYYLLQFWGLTSVIFALISNFLNFDMDLSVLCNLIT